MLKWVQYSKFVQSGVKNFSIIFLTEIIYIIKILYMLKSAYENMDNYLDILKALSDRTRLRIVRILLRAGVGLCVCEIMDSLNESQYNISRHLKELKHSGLVKCNEKGRWAFYSINKSSDKFIKLLHKAVMEIPFQSFVMDELRLKKRLSLRRNGECVVGMSKSKRKSTINKIEKRRA